MEEDQGVREPEPPLIAQTKPKKNRRIPKWVERLIGHAVALALFASIAYLMISHVRPDLLRPIFGGGGEPKAEKSADPAP